MRVSRSNLGRIACLAALVLVTAYFLTLGRDPLNRGLDLLRQWGPVPFYIVFALVISVGVPPTPFLLGAGAAFDFSTNVTGLALSYALSLSLSYFWASRLFRRRLEAFLAAKAPLVAGAVQDNPLVSTLLVRLTPGFPYMLQNCLLATLCRSFPLFLFASLPPLLLMALLFASVGKGLISGKLVLLVPATFLLLCLMLALRYIVRRRAAGAGD